ncbi:39S ribosomal protein L18, mitochondrial [Larimichthys crocea]|uniref:Uncharacterized protein n=1 Tax=Larimichthys crocea TaxID=215358 RepID=A0ACD3RD03_LARCR|nr:39S ribosomal protein L18, mitochondrial [Larimichthys crocea]
MSLSGMCRAVRLLGQIQRRRPVTARCLSQAASQPEPSADENEAVSPTFVNRNPRNLEQMALAVKDRGWKTTWPRREFYHRLEFSRSQHHVTAQVFSSQLSCLGARLFNQGVGGEEGAGVHKLRGSVSGCGRSAGTSMQAGRHHEDGVQGDSLDVPL